MNRTKPTAIPKAEQVVADLVALAQEATCEDAAGGTDAGLVEFDEEVIRLTNRGALFSNEIFACFV